MHMSRTSFEILYAGSFLLQSNTLREEILAGRNSGGLVDPPNPEHFGGIYFGRSRETFNLVGINFGGSGKNLYFAGISFGGLSEKGVRKGFDRKKKQSTLNGKKKTPI